VDPPEITIAGVPGLPEIEPGAELGRLIAAATELRSGDIVVISQKLVSKAEGRIRKLADQVPGPRAQELARELGKDPELVQLILDQSRRVIRAQGGVLITETLGGWVCANAGIDSSNLAEGGTVTLLPEDADVSARRIRAEIGPPSPAIVIADSFGRPWRLGQADVAIGAAGVRVLDDWRGRGDRAGRELEATMIAVADEVAAAADLVREKTSGTGVVVVRGLGRHVAAADGPGARALRRPETEDLFR
jgi:coenzyme F420-0:L-glutamate ligase/coenzyme F420-1:gamma-L-glutamate ligase